MAKTPNRATPMSSPEIEEPVADAVMEAKMREIQALFEDRPRVIRQMQKILPPARVRLLDTDFIVFPKDNWTEYLMWRDRRLPEHQSTQDLRDKLKDSGAVIVDVGANAGAFSLPILKAAGAGARAILFEPNPRMAARIRRNIELNAFDNVQLVECAVSDCETRSTLQFPANGNLGQARVDLGYANGHEGIEVAVRPLAACLVEAEVDRVDFLKVDVEGLEDRVIAPFLQSGTAPKPRLIYFEVAHRKQWAHPLDTILADTGYQLIADYGENALYERTT